VDVFAEKTSLGNYRSVKSPSRVYEEAVIRRTGSNHIRTVRETVRCDDAGHIVRPSPPWAGLGWLKIGIYVAISGQVARLYQRNKRIVADSHQSRRLRAHLLDDG
jgi:hypothetical protein